jgi:pilus assembly protein Flp/PilA
MIWMQEMHTRAIIALRSLVDREEGQGMVEYALILFLVSIVAIITLGLVGNDVDAVFDEVSDSITSVVD